MSALLGVPDHAREEWEELGDALTALGGTAPCQSADAEDWVQDGRSPAARSAADACLDCPAMTACGLYALAAGERTGVWGGMGPAERTRARREGWAS